MIHFTPLGGLGETGALNCMLYESDSTALIVDCGVSFVDHRHPGAALIIPNFEALEEVRPKLKGVVLTHGHEDHIGALPYLLLRHQLPVYATEFTLGVIQNKLKEFLLDDIEFIQIDYDKPFRVGDFELDPIYVNHSIPDVAAFCLRSQGLSVLHMTDFKIDDAAVEGRVTDRQRLKELGDEGLDLLFLDSTNSLVPGWTESESRVRSNLIELFTKIKGRIVTCLFSSNSYRVQSLIECARLTGRKIALTGRGTKEYAAVARSLHRFDEDGVSFYDVEDIHQFPDDQVLVLATGSQAEPRSVLARISQQRFRPFSLRDGDTVLMSSKMIPGNEGFILDMLDRLTALGAKVICADRNHEIHASGHAYEDELREVIRLTKPKNFVPIHGVYRALYRHCEIAVTEGVEEKRCLICLDGDRTRLDAKGLQIVDQTDWGVDYVSENRDIMITSEAIKRRRKLAWNGLVVVAGQWSFASGSFVDVSVCSEGLFGGDTERGALEDVELLLKRGPDGPVQENDAWVEKWVRTVVRQFYKQRYDIRPEVIVMIH